MELAVCNFLGVSDCPFGTVESFWVQRTAYFCLGKRRDQCARQNQICPGETEPTSVMEEEATEGEVDGELAPSGEQGKVSLSQRSWNQILDNLIVLVREQNETIVSQLASMNDAKSKLENLERLQSKIPKLEAAVEVIVCDAMRAKCFNLCPLQSLSALNQNLTSRLANLEKTESSLVAEIGWLKDSARSLEGVEGRVKLLDEGTKSLDGRLADVEDSVTRAYDLDKAYKVIFRGKRADFTISSAYLFGCRK